MSRTLRPAQRSRTRLRRALLLPALAAITIAAGCSTSVPGSAAADPAPAPAAGPGSDPAAWVDRVCGAVMAFATPATTEPDYTDSTDLTTVKKTFSAYLGSVVTGVQKGRQQLGTIGTSPVDGGDAAVGKIRTALTLVEQDFTGARATVDAADPTDPQAFLASLNQVQATLKTVKAPDALGELVAVPRLEKAAEKAPQCQQLSTLAAAVPH